MGQARGATTTAGGAPAASAEDYLRLLVELGLAFADAVPDYDALLGVVAERVAAATGDACTVRVLSGDGAWLAPAAADHPDPTLREAIRAHMADTPERADSGLWHPVVAERRSVRLALDPAAPSTVAAPAQAAFLRARRARALIAAPLLARGRVLGGISLVRFGAGALYAEADETFLRGIADRAAVALDNAALYRDARAELAERRRAEEALRALTATLEAQVAERTAALAESEARFRASLESAPDAILIADADGRIVLANRQAEALFGYARAELLGAAVETLLPEHLRARHSAHRAAYADDPRARPMGIGLQIVGRRKDGAEFLAEISLSPLHAGGERFYTAIVRDVTERAAAERRLRETAADLARSNEELEQFAYVASHDLQEPLRLIASYTQLLARRYRGQLDADADEFIGYAVGGANRMQQLIRDLLEYSRVGTRGGAFAPVDCGDMIATAMSDLGTAIAESGATVIAGALPTVSADRSQLRQLFQNLVENALKYRGDAPPVVQIDAAREGDSWHFTVRDNGIGIGPEYAERIFVIFQRLHTQAEYPGTGIGLALCKRIVARHGGRIWVESAAGKGATFHFTLPTAEAATNS